MSLHLRIHNAATNTLDDNLPSKVTLNFNEDGSVTLDGKRFTMSDFQSFGGFEPFCRFAFPYKGGVMMAHRDPIETVSKTAIGRRTGREVLYPGYESSPVSVVFVPGTTSLADAIWRVVLVKDGNGNAELTTNATVTSEQTEQSSFGVTAAEFPYKPSFECAGATVSADGSVSLTVTYVDPNGGKPSVNFVGRVKSDAGYLPKTKLNFVNGVASCKVVALGLVAGDAINLKFGIGDWSALGTATVQVV